MNQSGTRLSPKFSTDLWRVQTKYSHSCRSYLISILDYFSCCHFCFWSFYCPARLYSDLESAEPDPWLSPPSLLCFVHSRWSPLVSHWCIDFCRRFCSWMITRLLDTQPSPPPPTPPPTHSALLPRAHCGHKHLLSPPCSHVLCLLLHVIVIYIENTRLSFYPTIKKHRPWENKQTNKWSVVSSPHFNDLSCCRRCGCANNHALPSFLQKPKQPVANY